MLYAMQTSGADAILCLGGVQAPGRDGLRPDRRPGAGRHARRRRQRVRRRGQAPAVRPRRDRPARRADRGAGHRRRVRRPAAGRRRPARPGRARADLARRRASRSARTSARAVAERPSTSCCRRGRRPTSPARRGATTAGSRSPPTTTRRSALADDAAYEHLEVQVVRGQARLVPWSGCATTARCSWAIRPPSPTATRRSAPTTCCRLRARPPLHRRAVGRQVPQDVHLSAPDRRRARGASAPAVAAISHAEHFAGHALTADDAPGARRPDRHVTRDRGWDSGEMSDPWRLDGRVALVTGARPRPGPRVRARARRAPALG